MIDFLFDWIGGFIVIVFWICFIFWLVPVAIFTSWSGLTIAIAAILWIIVLITLVTAMDKADKRW